MRNSPLRSRLVSRQYVESNERICDVFPKNWASKNWKGLLACSPSKEGGKHEEAQVFGGTDCHRASTDQYGRGHSQGHTSLRD